MTDTTRTEMLTCTGCGSYIAGQYWHEGCAGRDAGLTDEERSAVIAMVLEDALDGYGDAHQWADSIVRELNKAALVKASDR